MSTKSAKPGEVYIEFIPQGAYVKVSAICAQTGFEVSIVGDAKASQKELEALAVRKLNYVMSRDKTAGPRQPNSHQRGFKA